MLRYPGGGIRDVKSRRASAIRKGRPEPGKHPLLSRGAALGELPEQNCRQCQVANECKGRASRLDAGWCQLLE